MSHRRPSCPSLARRNPAIDGAHPVGHAACMRALNIGLLALVAVGGAGCARTFRAEAVQPNPMTQEQSAEVLPISERVTIITGDMELDAPDAPAPGERVT